jgi:hypothetical protein
MEQNFRELYMEIYVRFIVAGDIDWPHKSIAVQYAYTVFLYCWQWHVAL